ncbi:MAG: hypothetical protein ACYC5F_09815 [Thermoleophilia bacterium]
MRQRPSNGRAGEEAALYWFKDHGWQMWKVPPDVRVCGKTGRPGVFLAAFKTGGMPDYVGHYRYEHVDGDVFQRVAYCEVKECNTNSMPASRLSRAQREFMVALPGDAAYVGILWDEYFEMFPFIETGSYKQGSGIR